MLAISLMRMGAKKNPFYRVVVKEKRSKRDGKYIENLGTYNPMANPAEVELKHERIQYWIGVGAQPTETVASLIKNNPAISDEEKEAKAKAKAEKAETEKQARLEAKRLEAEKLEAEIAAAEKAAAEAVEAESASEETAGDEASAKETVEASSAQDAATEDASAEEAAMAGTEENAEVAGE
jgi:small subunit ribosomal protein S16